MTDEEATAFTCGPVSPVWKRAVSTMKAPSEIWRRAESSFMRLHLTLWERAFESLFI
jgi:hypothetical protein